MPRKKMSRPLLKLIECELTCEPKLPEVETEVDELALLIRSINETGRKAKAKSCESSEPEPPTPLAA